MEAYQITQLARILRRNGEQVLNASSKFSLSTNMLSTLNSHFVTSQLDPRDTTTTFQVISSSNIKTEIYSDLQFLYEFVRRTISLKLTPPTLTRKHHDDVIEINLFRNLKYLELYKIKVDCVHGIQSLRTQLQYLTCIHSIETLSDILEKCGADESSGFIWCELKEAIFSNNNLTNLDSSLNQVPWLHTLDLSHNALKNTEALSCLSNLKYLNLSYNQLEVAPVFTGQLCNRLQVLLLHNNFIEECRELSVLVNLCELDLANNCLIEHESVGSVAYLAALQWLNLSGNPLTFHPQHRTRTARFLHANTASVKFMLDRSLLTRNEKKLAGTLRLITQRSLTSSLTESATVAPSERQKRVRNATITEDNQEVNPDFDCSFSSLLLSNDHLETKQKVEQIRNEYGEAWLQSQGGGSLLQDALGLDFTALPVSSSPYEHDFLLHAAESETNKKPVEVTSDNVYVTASESDSFYAGEGESTEVPTDEEPDEDLGESEDNLYLATVLNETNPVFVLLTNSHIWERDENGKERARWPLETLLSCELLGDDCNKVRLEFDTVRRDRNERTYILDVDDATKLACVLKNILDIRPPQFKLLVYRCMKCSTQFSNEKKRGRKIVTPECPVCSSTVIIEDDGN